MSDLRVKKTVLLEKSLFEEIDKLNPFNTRMDFLNQACKAYLKQLRRRTIDDELAKACAESSEAEDWSVSEEWESVVWGGGNEFPKDG